jgi:hypothetical protein
VLLLGVNEGLNNPPRDIIGEIFTRASGHPVLIFQHLGERE